MRLFLAQAIVLVLITFLYVYVGIYEGLVFTVYWFDILLHALGGLWSALAVAWFFSLLGARLSFPKIIFFAFIVGLSWEAFEYVFDIGGSNFMSYEADTAKDVLVDLFGGAIGGKLVHKGVV